MSFPLFAGLLGVLVGIVLILRTRQYESAHRRETLYAALGVLCLGLALLVNVLPRRTATTVASVTPAAMSVVFVVLEWRLWLRVRTQA
jgi:drug/metabolite transporter (DMT)-like permease